MNDDNELSNTPELNLPGREELIQQVLEAYPQLTREEAEEMLMAFRAI